MSVGGTIFEPHSPYRFPPSSRNHHVPPSLNPLQSPVKRDPSRQSHPWQFHQAYGESHHFAGVNMAAPSQNEMERFQQLSDRYQPEIQGPLVGNKTSIGTLISEYAQADPVFVAKTISLSSTHSAYRPIKGDGQCGWRGAVFGYFETLLLIGDVQMIVQEQTRLQSFDETMRMVGIDVEIVMDMFDYTWDLFESIRRAAEAQQTDDSILTAVFNDEGQSNSIVYHFKMMTSAFMQLREDQYQPFLDMSLAEYRLSRIDPTNQEIDQIGLQGLTDGVIAPAGIAVEVSYLDRSEGDEVTPHQFVPNSAGWPAVRLLYRPGHYDMIYKDIRPVRVLYQNQQISFQSNMMGDFTSPDIDTTSYIFPCTTIYPGVAHDIVGGSGSSTSRQQQHFNYAGDMQYHHNSFVHPPYSTYSTVPVVAPQESQTWSAPIPVRTMSTSTVPTMSAPSPVPAPPRRASSVSSPLPMQPTQEPQIRMSTVFYDFGRNGHETIPLETGSLRNSSPGTQNHFLSANFQPQIWDAEEEYPRS